MSDDRDYAHMRDPQAQRTRLELWAIVVIVAVVIVGALIWRSVAHAPATPQKGWNSNGQVSSGDALAPAAAAGVRTVSPPPRPAGP